MSSPTYQEVMQPQALACAGIGEGTCATNSLSPIMEERENYCPYPL